MQRQAPTSSATAPALTSRERRWTAQPGIHVIFAWKRAPFERPMAPAAAGHNEAMRVGALACLVGLASLACGGSEIASIEGGAPPASGAMPEGSVPAGGDSSSGGGVSPGVGPSPVPSSRSTDGGCAALQGNAAPLPIGAPCVSPSEMEPSFAGAVEQEISTVSNSPQCGEWNVCLYNHLQGRVTCPNGQDKNGVGPRGTPGCVTLGTCEPVRPNIPGMGQTVQAQCSNRTAASA